MTLKESVLVTGGAGYVGSHAAKALAVAGYIPVVLDNLCRGHRDFVRWGPFEHGDIRDCQFLEEVFSRWNPKAVMHFAALAYVGESVEEPAKYFSNNVTGTLCLLDTCRKIGIRTLVFSSSCAVYGRPGSLPVTEAFPLNPISAYGASKAISETVLESYVAAYGLRVVSLRYFNAAGADPDGELGERHEPETHLIPLAIKAALGMGSRLQLFGTDYPTPDGTCIRDYVHVSDLAAAHIAGLKYLEASGASTCINLGTGTGYSSRQVLDSVASVLGRSVPINVAPRRPGDPPALVADPKRAFERLQWRPRFSDLEDIIRTAVCWHQQETTRARAQRPTDE